MASKKRALSAIQTSGKVTLGNLLGAQKNWVLMQEDYECFFGVADLHALTVLPEPKLLNELTLEALALMLSVGIDHKKTTVFIQSHIPQHTELAWILTCLTGMGELNRMTQFKDKSEKQKHIGAGLFTYPTLMASDILLYQTDVVPVGEDQKQHMELCRDLAGRFHSSYKDGIFKIPEPVIPKIGARIMSLSNPKGKMSKSDTDPNATIFLTDDPKKILKKFKKAVTDSDTEIRFDVENKPGVSNLLSIQSAINGKSIDDLVQSYQGKMYGHLKVETGEMVVELLKPVKEKFDHYISDPGELLKIFQEGNEKAQAVAQKTLNNVKEAVGLVQF